MKITSAVLASNLVAIGFICLTAYMLHLNRSGWYWPMILAASTAVYAKSATEID